MRLQVFTFGHSLSNQTKEFLSKIDANVKIYNVPFHITRFDRTLLEIDQVLEKLRRAGADMSGRTRTVFVPSGTSTGAIVFAAAWLGLTGDLPEILNLIRRGETHFVPSPEMPILNLPEYSDKKMEDDPELISLQRVKATIRQNKRAKRNELECTVETVTNKTDWQRKPQPVNF